MRRDPDFAIFCGKFEFYEHDEIEVYKIKPGVPDEIAQAIERYRMKKLEEAGGRSAALDEVEKHITEARETYYPNMCEYMRQHKTVYLPCAQAVPRAYYGVKIDLFYKYLLDNGLIWQQVLNGDGNCL